MEQEGLPTDLPQMVSSDEVNAAIAHLAMLAINCQLQETATAIEASMVRLSISDPDELMQSRLEDLTGLIIDALELGIPPVLNAGVYGD